MHATARRRDVNMRLQNALSVEIFTAWVALFLARAAAGGYGARTGQ